MSEFPQFTFISKVLKDIEEEDLKQELREQEFWVGLQ